MNTSLRFLFLAIFAIGISCSVFGGGETETQDAEGPTPFVVYRPGFTLDPKTDPILLEMQERLNIDLRVITVPWNETGAKARLVVETGEKANVVHFLSFANHPLAEWARDGIMYRVDDYVNATDHPYLTKMIEDPALAETKIDGGFYYPVSVSQPEWVIAIRQDWLDNLGLDMPKNLSEFRAVLEAFTYDDPDGNGKDDTVGMQHETILRSFEPVAFSYGVSNWRLAGQPMHVKNGRVVHEFWTEGFKEAMRYMNGLYRDELINTDFPLHQTLPATCDNYFYPGRAGVAWIPFQFIDNIQGVDPSVAVRAIPPFATEPGFDQAGARGLKNREFNGFPTKGGNIEKTLEVFEYMVSPEGRKLMIAGIHGVHWTGEIDSDGLFDRDEEAWNRDYGDVPNAEYPLAQDWFTSARGGWTPINDWPTFSEAAFHPVNITARSDYEDKYWNTVNGYNVGAEHAGYPGPFNFVNLESVAQISARLDEALNVAWQSMLTAESDSAFENEWQKYRKEFERIGIERYIQAYQDYYDANMK